MQCPSHRSVCTLSTQSSHSSVLRLVRQSGSRSVDCTIIQWCSYVFFSTWGQSYVCHPLIETSYAECAEGGIVKSGFGRPVQSQLWGLGEHYKLPQWMRGPSSGRHRISCMLRGSGSFWWHFRKGLIQSSLNQKCMGGLRVSLVPPYLSAWEQMPFPDWLPSSLCHCNKSLSHKILNFKCSR